MAGAMLAMGGQAFAQERDALARKTPPVIGEGQLAMLSWSSFYPFINTDFTFGQGYNAVSLKLRDMTDSRPPKYLRKDSMGENFVMKFQGPSRQRLRQGTYQVSHFNLGDFELFITDGGRAGRTQYYVAVINRVTG